MRHISKEAVTMNTGKIWGSFRLGSQIVSRGYFVPGRAGSKKTTGGFWPSRRPPALSSLSGHRLSEGNYDDEEDRNRQSSGADHQRRHARLGEAEGGRWTDLFRHPRGRPYGRWTVIKRNQHLAGRGARSLRLVQGGEASTSPPFSTPVDGGLDR